MDDYNSYVTAVNKIYDYLEKMKAGWDGLDNKNYISSIEEYKNVVISKADLMKQPPTVSVEETEVEQVPTNEETQEPVEDTPEMEQLDEGKSYEELEELDEGEEVEALGE